MSTYLFSIVSFPYTVIHEIHFFDKAEPHLHFPFLPLIGAMLLDSFLLHKQETFLTDSVFHVLFTYFDESMASKIVYKP